MTTARTRIASVVALAVALVTVWALPAAAATPVVADDQFKWFFWIGPLLALSIIGLVIGVIVGYYLKVMRPKWRSRQA